MAVAIPLQEWNRIGGSVEDRIRFDDVVQETEPPILGKRQAGDSESCTNSVHERTVQAFSDGVLLRRVRNCGVKTCTACSEPCA